VETFALKSIFTFSFHNYIHQRVLSTDFLDEMKTLDNFCRIMDDYLFAKKMTDDEQFEK
jgi:hypothetical protein